MMKNTLMLLFIMAVMITFSMDLNGQSSEENMKEKKQVEKTEEQWRQELSAEEYRVLRQCGTEPAFTGKYYNHNKEGTYTCAACGAKLFSSDSKYESGSGWPSFYAAMNKKAIIEEVDTSYGMRRIEIKCARCGSHLGHVFPDGPEPTGLRYCVNSLSLEFINADKPH